MQLETESHTSRELQNDWDKLGADSFSFEVLELLEPLDDPAADCGDDLEFLETIWLNKLQPYGDRGYNRMKISGQK